MSRPVVQIVQTGTANTASVVAALTRAGARPELTTDADAVERATRVVLPGVGSFGGAMTRLRDLGLTEVLRERVVQRRPLLCVCLGLQVLAAESEESPGVRGLDVWPLQVRRLSSDVRVPQLGWNIVEPGPACSFLERGYAYFANSFALCQAPAGWSAAYTTYGRDLVSAVESGPVLACQFHPELSGVFGARLIRRWMEGAARC